MTKVIIEIKGGVVQAIYSTSENIKIGILDRDNYKDRDCQGEELEHYQNLEKTITKKEYTQIY